MVAASLANEKAETVLRPFDPLRDLGPLADLLEVAFADRLRAEGRGMVADLRAMRWMSPLVWALFHSSEVFRAGLEGYVWIEGGRLVGNASLAAVGHQRWSIGNVAVHPDYRNQGIARRLMEAAIAHARDLGGTLVMLEVHADNPPAIHLYEVLGFRRQDAMTDLRRPAAVGFEVPGGPPVRWRLPGGQSASRPLDYSPAGAIGGNLDLRPIPWHQWRKVYELALAATPPAAWAIRPVRESAFRRSPLSALAELLTGRRVVRWAVATAGSAAGDFDAMGALETSRWELRPHRLTLMVRPSRAAELAEPLAAYVMQVAASLPPADVVARVRPDPPNLVQALERHGFVAELTTVQMALELSRHGPVQLT